MDGSLPQAVHAHRAVAVADLRSLISFDTTLPPGGAYAEITDWLALRLTDFAFQTEVVVVPETLWQPTTRDFAGPRVNLIARRRSGKPALTLCAHTDVVPAGPGWSIPPLAGIVDGDRVYGRGAADMKGAIASLLTALRALAAVGWPLAFDPVLLFCTDEEGGAFPGVRFLAERGDIEGHVLCLDGQAAPRRWLGCCGMVDYQIAMRGRSGHSGAPDRTATNAVEGAVPVMAALLELKARVERRVSTMAAAPWEQQPYVHPLLNITMIRGGTKPNVIPGECDLRVNRRYLPEESLADVLAEIDAVIQGSGASVGFSGMISHLPPVREPLGPHWPHWEAALAEGFGFQMSDFTQYGSASSSDMGWVQAAGYDEILLGGVARPDSNIHGPDEWVFLEDVLALASALAIYLSDEEAARVRVPGRERGNAG